MIVVAARSVLTFACLMVIGSLLLLLVVPPGSGEFVITVVTLGLGGLLLAIAAFILRAVYVHETSFIDLDEAGGPAEETPDLPQAPARTHDHTRTLPGPTKEEM